eukprot:GHVU01153828.1.p1 GENE.GHVU01153828.1~~GHVU01153828.1.p1  ORF type:complete len:709 (+),score=62.36 GHVU01153828.1:204-2330(+)
MDRVLLVFLFYMYCSVITASEVCVDTDSSSCTRTHIVTYRENIVLNCMCEGCDANTERVRWSHKKVSTKTIEPSKSICDVIKTNEKATYTQHAQENKEALGLTCYRNYSLIVHNVTEHRQGEYCCEIMGNNSMTCYIVKLKVLPTDIEMDVPSDPVHINDTVTLTCRVPRSNPPAKIQVTRTDKPGKILNGTTKETENPDGTFKVVTRVTVVIMDKVPSLTYQCSVEGTNVKKQKSLNINYGAETKVDEITGQTAGKRRFECVDLRSNPFPDRYTWQLNGKVIETNESLVILENGRKLDISTSTEKIKGTLTCRGFNGHPGEKCIKSYNLKAEPEATGFFSKVMQSWWLVVLVIVLVVLLVLLIGVLIGCSRRNTKYAHNQGRPLDELSLMSKSNMTMNTNSPGYRQAYYPGVPDNNFVHSPQVDPSLLACLQDKGTYEAIGTFPINRRPSRPSDSTLRRSVSVSALVAQHVNHHNPQIAAQSMSHMPGAHNEALYAVSNKQTQRYMRERAERMNPSPTQFMEPCNDTTYAVVNKNPRKQTSMQDKSSSDIPVQSFNQHSDINAQTFLPHQLHPDMDSENDDTYSSIGSTKSKQAQVDAASVQFIPGTGTYEDVAFSAQMPAGAIMADPGLMQSLEVQCDMHPCGASEVVYSVPEPHPDDPSPEQEGEGGDQDTMDADFLDDDPGYASIGDMQGMGCKKAKNTDNKKY